MERNIDERVVSDFGREWSRFDQSDVPREQQRATFERYFSVFPWSDLPENAAGFDLGCGSGRWASFVAPRVGTLHCIDAAGAAIEVARRNLAGSSNVVFHVASVDGIPVPDDSMDFGYSVGVLHHIPDTAAAMASCVRKLKPGAPFLVYLYYAFDNRPGWFKLLWRASDLGRRAISSLPHPLKLFVSQTIALLVYLPLARTARFLERRGKAVGSFPLSSYRSKRFYTMRTDALDRFGTRLEQRFTRLEIEQMMTAAGLRDISFREDDPFWCAVGSRAGEEA